MAPVAQSVHLKKKITLVFYFRPQIKVLFISFISPKLCRNVQTPSVCFFPSRHIIKNLANTFTSRLSHLALPRSVSSTFLLTSSKNGFIISCSHTEERCDSHLLHKLRVLKFNSRSAFSPCLIYHLCALIFSSNCLARWRELNSRDTVSASYPSHLCFIKKTPELGLEIKKERRDCDAVAVTEKQRWRRVVDDRFSFDCCAIIYYLKRKIMKNKRKAQIDGQVSWCFKASCQEEESGKYFIYFLWYNCSHSMF